MAENKKEDENIVEEEEKEISINKYSIYDLKSGLDTRLVETLETMNFEENNSHTNIKIFSGLFCLVWTALAYFNGKEFPDNYNIILISLILYGLGSILYWYVENYIIKCTIYIGSNSKYFSDTLRNTKIKNIKINSDIKENDNNYYCWLTVISWSGKEYDCNTISKNFCDFYDERGHCKRAKVEVLTNEILKSASSLNQKIE